MLRQQGPTPEEGGTYGRPASRTEEAGAAAEFQQRGRYLPGAGAQPHLAMRGGSYQQPPLPRQQPPPGALQHRQGGLPPLHRLPPPQQAMSVAHRQAQQQHFQQMGRLASMQSAQVTSPPCTYTVRLRPAGQEHAVLQELLRFVSACLVLILAR